MSADPELLARLTVARSIAREAGATATKTFRSSDLRVRTKSSELDLVTNADVATQRVVIDRIQREFRDDAIIAEEGLGAAGSTGFTWAIDPIDGTANYALGLPHWCISVGVLAEGMSVVGAIYDPLLDDVFSAAVGDGAHYGTNRIERPLRQLRLSTWAIGLAEELQASRRVLWEESVLPRIGRQRAMGSLCLDFAWAAAGYVDAAFYECRLQAWDYGACEIICREAGLRVLRLNGAPGQTSALIAFPEDWMPEMEPILSALS